MMMMVQQINQESNIYCFVCLNVLREPSVTNTHCQDACCALCFAKYLHGVKSRNEKAQNDDANGSQQLEQIICLQCAKPFDLTQEQLQIVMEAEKHENQRRSEERAKRHEEQKSKMEEEKKTKEVSVQQQILPQQQQQQVARAANLFQPPPLASFQIQGNPFFSNLTQNPPPPFFAATQNNSSIFPTQNPFASINNNPVQRPAVQQSVVQPQIQQQQQQQLQQTLPSQAQSSEVFDCFGCEQKNLSHDAFVQHVLHTHPKGMQVSCGICVARGGDPFYQSIDLPGHVYMRHSKNPNYKPGQ